MADILIKNMEMPKDCEECRFHSKQDVIVKGCVVHFCRAQRVGRTYNLHDGCPLVALPSHGDLIDRGLVQEVLAQLLPLVITNELTDKEIGLVHRTVGAIAEMINEQEVVVEATE